MFRNLHLIRDLQQIFLLSLAAILIFSNPGISAEIILTSDHDAVSLKQEIDRSFDLSFKFLKKSQNPDGSWSNPDFPAITGLVAYAFLSSRQYGIQKNRPEFLQKALKYIVQNAHDNGAIYKEGLPNYNTSICMMALLATQDEAFYPYILQGRRYLASLQMDSGKKGKTDQLFDGGIGYGTKDHSDMSNTYLALEAIRLSRFLESDEHLAAYKNLQEIKNTSLDWDAALKFIERCQNLPKYNDQKWASNDPKNKGGFVYYPGSSKAGEEKLANGKTALRSYGSMTYAGLLSLIYADLKKDDPRIQAAYGWLKQNFTLDNNPGMDQQGLFYYYHTMAKALTVYGDEYLITEDNRKIDWRKELAVKLVEKQKGGGFWINESGRWWENDPVLVTAYSLISLNLITPYL